MSGGPKAYLCYSEADEAKVRGVITAFTDIGHFVGFFRGRIRIGNQLLPGESLFLLVLLRARFVGLCAYIFHIVGVVTGSGGCACRALHGESLFLFVLLGAGLVWLSTNIIYLVRFVASARRPANQVWFGGRLLLARSRN